MAAWKASAKRQSGCGEREGGSGSGRRTPGAGSDSGVVLAVGRDSGERSPSPAAELALCRHSPLRASTGLPVLPATLPQRQTNCAAGRGTSLLVAAREASRRRPSGGSHRRGWRAGEQGGWVNDRRAHALTLSGRAGTVRRGRIAAATRSRCATRNQLSFGNESLNRCVDRFMVVSTACSSLVWRLSHQTPERTRSASARLL
jgi:hypothetical protein